MEKSSTPSLVGVSVRSINDSNNPDFKGNRGPRVAEARSSPQLLEKIHSSTQLNKLNSAYTTVDELNREGALLTDDNDVDLDKVVQGDTEGAGDRRKTPLKRKKNVNNGNKALSSSSLSISSMISPSQSRSSLVTSTDPVHDHTGDGNAQAGAASAGDEDRIRNSYGEFITNRSHRPHLASGESYQSTQNDTAGEDAGAERHGRSSKREDASRGYLRSLSRSLSRDPQKKAHDQEQEDSRMYSTNNYRISQLDLENAPHVIKEEIEEEQDQGALMDDEGNEEYSEQLRESASKQLDNDKLQESDH
ncbi:LAQU0S02e05006g1_1 [Lachancea quebecensis]|uniref:LAQU0S02e05006g1_1 n=1 Tax=Lachancea quebecensis TaxID=1654605 RepID=A0A0P1KMS4_9SACH|nr:LAQU0S02e05006g1_1 [Lachancea quebecensis]